jgi:F-box and WD-40 domain protein CDC4
MNWRRGGQLLRAHRVPAANPERGVVTSVALDADWVVAGLANCRIHVFSARTGVLSRTLIGHELGVWAVHLISKGGASGQDDDAAKDGGISSSQKGSRDRARRARKRRSEDRDESGESSSWGMDDLFLDDSETNLPTVQPSLDHLVPPSLRSALRLDSIDAAAQPKTQCRTRVIPDGKDEQCDGQDTEVDVGKRSDACCASEGWGQPNALVVSGGCDKVLRVWDVKTG